VVYVLHLGISAGEAPAVLMAKVGRPWVVVVAVAAGEPLGCRSWSVGRAELVSGEYHGRDRAGAIRFAVGFYGGRRM
jgi:hypothetical protein